MHRQRCDILPVKMTYNGVLTFQLGEQIDESARGTSLQFSHLASTEASALNILVTDATFCGMGLVNVMSKATAVSKTSMQTTIPGTKYVR